MVYAGMSLATTVPPPDDTSIPDMYAGHDHHSIPDPHIVADEDRLLGTEALFHHGDIRSGELVVPCDDRYIRAHHNVIPDVAGAVYLGIDPDAGTVAQCDLLAENGILLDIDLFTALRQHQFAAEAPQRRLTQMQGAVRYRKTLRHRAIEQRAKLSPDTHRSWSVRRLEAVHLLELIDQLVHALLRVLMRAVSASDHSGSALISLMFSQTDCILPSAPKL